VAPSASVAAAADAGAVVPKARAPARGPGVRAHKAFDYDPLADQK
jgi:hypothetical protein